MWDFPGSGIEPTSPALAGRFFTTVPPGKPLLIFWYFFLICFVLILHTMFPCLLSRFSVVLLFVILWSAHCQASLSMKFFQARILEWIAMPSFRGPPWPRDRTCISLCFLGWQVGSLPLYNVYVVQNANSFFFLNVYILLNCSWLTVFQVHRKVILLCIYTYYIKKFFWL